MNTHEHIKVPSFQTHLVQQYQTNVPQKLYTHWIQPTEVISLRLDSGVITAIMLNFTELWPTSTGVWYPLAEIKVDFESIQQGSLIPVQEDWSLALFGDDLGVHLDVF